MFAKFTTVVLALATLAAAIPTQQCNTGDVQCCNQVQEASSPFASELLGLVGVVVGDVTGQVGIDCTPVTALLLAGSGANCVAQPVCCEDNSFNGVVALGCTPVNANL